MSTLTLQRPVTLAVATFSVTGGLAKEYADRGEMIPWAGVLAVEGIETGDRRLIAPGALEWRELPLPFMFQYENPVAGEGHDGATLVGRIDSIERLDDGRMWATGYIDPSMPDALTLVNAMDKGLLRGVSVDLDKVATMEVEGPDGVKRLVIASARISGATGCPFQAIMEAEIAFDIEKMEALAASGAEPEGKVARMTFPIDGVETIVASGGDSILVAPPADWFANPQFTELTPLTVTASGQVFGHIAAWGTCHISFSNRCQQVPRSSTKYAAFRTGSVVTAEGTTVRTGPIVMDTVHPDLRWRASDAQAFYADTGCVVCDVVPYEDQFGIAIAGALRPGVSPAQLRAFRASDISPDWRNVNGAKHEMVAMLAVNNSGFKLPQTLVAAAGQYVEPGETAMAIDAFDEVFALVASGPMQLETEELGCGCGGKKPEMAGDCGCEASTETDELAARRAAIAAGRFAPKQPTVLKFRQASEMAGFDKVPRDGHGRWTGKGGKGGVAPSGAKTPGSKNPVDRFLDWQERKAWDKREKDHKKRLDKAAKKASTEPEVLRFQRPG